MAILHRRALQNLLDRISRFLAGDQLAALVNRLNSTTKNSLRDVLAAEWEVIMVSACSATGNISYEIPGAEGRRPDLLLQLPDGRQILFEVSSISDIALEKSNPINDLQERFGLLRKKLGESGVHGGFSVRVGRQTKGVGPKNEIHLALPKRHEFSQWIFDSAFAEYIRRIRSAPARTHRHRVLNKHADVNIVFEPNAKYVSFSYPEFKSPRAPRTNPIYNALKGKAKRKQLGSARGERLSRGFVLCDGACDLFGDFLGGPTLRRIVLSFLRSHKSVDFVCAVDIQEGFNSKQFRYRIFTNLNESLEFAIGGLLHRGFASLPNPARTALSARNYLEWHSKKKRTGKHPYYQRGFSMSDRRIEISARAVLDCLTGEVSRPEFLDIVGHYPIEFLQKHLAGGGGLSCVRLEKAVDDDDDLLVLDLSDADAATAEFSARPLAE